jgi:hypothetical protein
MPDSLQAKLAAARLRWRSFVAAGGLAVTFTILAFLVVASFWSDRWLVLTSGGRMGWLVGLIAGAALCVILFILRPLRRPMPDEAVAAHVERAFPALNERLLSTISLARAGSGAGVSSAMVSQLAQETERLSAPLNFRRAIPSTPVRRPAAFAGVAGLLLFGHAALAPAAMNSWMQRILHPGADIPIYSYTQVWATPGDLVVPRGEDVMMGVITGGKPTDRAVLHYRFENGPWIEAALDKPRPSGDKLQFAMKLHDLQQGVTYYATAGDGQANPHTIRVEDRPTILNVSLKLNYPTYTGRRSEVVSATAGNIVAPVGTHVEISATANKPLKTATLLENGKAEGPWPVHGDNIKGSLVVQKDQTYGLNLTDINGFKALTPPQYTVRAQPDQTPQVQITKPGADIERTPGGTVDLRVTATDDYGVRDLRLSYKASAKNGGIPLPGANGSKEVQSGGAWDLSNLNLKAGDTVAYEAIAQDNDAVSGPHTAHSAKYQIKIVGLNEMRERIDSQKAQEQEALRQLIQHQADAQKQLEKAKQTPGDLAKSQQAQQSQRNAASEASELSKKMQQTTNQMRDNNIGSKTEQQRRESADKTLSQLAQKQMPAAADSIQKNQMSSAAQQEQAIKDQLEQLGQKTSPAQTAAQLAQQAEQLAKEQQKLADQASLADAKMQSKSPSQMTPEERKQLKDLAKQQADLKAKTDALQKQLDQAAKESQEKSQPNSSDMKNAAKQMQASDTAKKQANAQQKLQSGQPSEAAPQQRSAAKDLQNLADQLDKAAQNAADQQSLEQKADRMEKLAEKLSALARTQATATTEIARNPGMETAAKLSQQEKDVHDQAKKIADQLGQMPQTQQTVSRASDNTQQAAGHLDEHKNKDAEPPAREATRQLLQASMDLQQAAQQMRNAQDAKESQHALEQLAKDQRALRAQTQQLEAGRKNGQLTPEQQKSAQALAQNQAKLAERAQTLTKDMPSDGFKWATREAGERMQNAKRGLEQSNPGQNTQRQQENAAQTLERIARALGQQAQGQQQQAESGGQQSSSESSMAQASGELKLSREMQAQIRQETGNLEERRKQNPNRQLSADQQRELENLARAERETHRITQRAARELKGAPEISKTVQKAADSMEDVQDLLSNKKETNEDTQGRQDKIVGMLDQAIGQAQQAMREQRQQMAKQQKPGPGQQQAQSESGQMNEHSNKPNQGMSPITGKQASAFNKYDPRGKGFTGLSPRAQQSMREGKQERVPAEYRDLVNQYYKALSEHSK